ncbi:DEAD/DEAH box helicase [Bradyrhizobium sp. USDA 4471]
MITLRPYQQRDVLEIRGIFARRIRRVLYVLATGGGKTIVFSFIVGSAIERGKRVLILAHRVELVDQASAALSALGIEHGIIAPGHPRTDHAVQIGSVATVIRRHRDVGQFDLVIIDEAHHGASRSYRRIFEVFGDAFVLGVTATSERLDGEPLDMFDQIVIGPDTATLIGEGFLSPYVLYAPASAPDLSGVRNRAGDFAVDDLASVMSRPVIIASAVSQYLDKCWGAPAIAFCVDRSHSQALAEAFIINGVRAAHVDGDTPAAERRRLIAALGTGDLDVLCNCGLVSEGLDVPGVVGVILLRPTQSLSMYLQQVGRALRVAPGKSRAMILDLAGNVFRHGLPDTPREWSLAGREKKDRAPPPVVARLRHCPACRTLNPPGTGVCSCGTELKPTSAERRDAALELVRVRQEQLQKLSRLTYGECLSWAGTSEERLQMVALARGYKRGFVHKRLIEIAEKRSAS